MRIPSPRTFFEIAALVLFGIFMTIGVILAVVVLVIWIAIEKSFDGLQGLRKRRRA